MEWRNLLVLVVIILLTPLLYIAAFNAFLGTAVAYTAENWIRVLLVSVLVSIVVILLLAFAGIFGGTGALVLAVGILLFIPVIFIWAFNLVLMTNVPTNVISYLIVAAILILVAFISFLIGLAGHR